MKHLDKYNKFGDCRYSVTQFISLFKEQFDKDRISKAVAYNQGKTQDEVLKEWKQAGIDGTALHNYIENFYKNGENAIPKTQREKIFHKFYEDHKNKITVEKVEAPIYHPKYKMPGTVDYLGYSKKLGGKIIMDWKTGKSISKVGYGNYFEPVNHLEDSKFNEYSLQLSIYKLILEEIYGMEIKGMFLVHILDSGYEVIPCDNLVADVQFMLLSAEFVRNLL